MASGAAQDCAREKFVKSVVRDYVVPSVLVALAVVQVLFQQGQHRGLRYVTMSAGATIIAWLAIALLFRLNVKRIFVACLGIVGIFALMALLLALSGTVW